MSMPIKDPRVIQTAASVTTHSPWFVEYLEDWRKFEVDRLAYSKDDFTVRQGRVQLLDEVLRLFLQAEVDLQRMRP